MKFLKQKYHGLPGLGVNGKTGDQGSKAQSIYIGFINDFFDGDKIDVGTFIYAAKRMLGNVADDSSVAWKVVQDEIKSVFGEDTNIFLNAVSNSSTNPTSYINYNNFYFTNTRLLNANINNDIVQSFNSSISDIELDITGDYINMAFMIHSLDNPNISKLKQFKSEEDTKAYIKFNQPVGQFSNHDISELYNINNEITYYQFDESAKILLNLPALENSSIKQIFLPYDTNDAIYKRDSNAGIADENGTILTNIDYSDYYIEYPKNSKITYIKDDNLAISENGKVFYVLDGNIAYGDLSWGGLITKYVKDDKHLFLGDANDMFDAEYDTWPSFYKTSFKSDFYYTERDLQDDTKQSFYGIASPKLFINKGDTNVKLNENELKNIEDIWSSYIEKYQNASIYMDAILKSENDLYVYYSINSNDQNIFVPTTLKQDFVVGDVLYFYVNEQEFNDINNPNFQNLLYMVILTEDLLKCTPSELINSAQLISPLKIKLFSENNNRLQNFNNVTTLYNPVNDNSTKLSNKSFINITENYTTAPVLIGTAKNNNNFIYNNTFTAVNGEKTYSLHGIINVSNNFDISCNNTIKLNTLCVCNNISSQTNVELYKYIYNSNVKLYNNNFIKPLLDLEYYYDENNKSSIFIQNINADDYFYNIEQLNDYFFGCDIYNSKLEKINTITSNNKNLEIDLVPTVENDTYYFQMFATIGSSLKYYSKFTKLSLTYKVFKYYDDVKEIDLPTLNNRKYYGKAIGQFSMIKKQKKNRIPIERISITEFKLSILGENQNIIKEKKAGNIFFDLSDITAEKIINASLTVYPIDSSIVIDSIKFNRDNEINWAEINYNGDILDVSSFSINLSTNLPLYEGNSYNYINEYVLSGCSSESENIEGANIIVESSLFKNLNNPEFKIPETKQRSILVTAEYHYIDNEAEHFYENFNIVQPGFKDTRDMPVIELNTHTNIEELTAYNSIENGVTTNQFVTYIDINIKDFKKQWQQFVVSNDVSVYLDISILNTDYDLNWQDEYNAEGLTERRTFRTILENNDVDHLNNYIKIVSAAFETSDDLLKLNQSKYTSKEGNLSCGGTYNLSDTYILYSNSYSDNSKNIITDDSYIVYDSSFVNVMKTPQVMFAGLQDNILLELKNIPVCDDIDTIKLKVLLEMGNPVLANMYLRFVVSNLTIKVNDSVFKTFTKDSFNNIVGTYLAKTTNEYEGMKLINKLYYKYISKPIDIMFNPLSYTICPNDVESSYTNIYGNEYKYGIKEQIKKELRFFNSSIYENNPFVYSEKDIRIKKYYPFKNLYIKKSYIQDNIKSINAYPISLWDSIKYIDVDNHLSSKINEELKTHNVLDFIEGNKYLSVVYHSTLMWPKLINDDYIFYYNDNKYQRSKYNQKNNNMPIFAYDSQSIELRDDELINSMDKWNDYYAESVKYNISKTYQGVLSLYGNGYTQILNDEYNLPNILSITDVKQLNDVSINLEKGINEVDIEPSKNIQPNNKEYFRGFLYDINWEFPYYDNINIQPYRIVSGFDNYLNNYLNNNISSDKGIYKVYKDYYSALTSSNLYADRMVPYTLLFDINSRIAYNYENNAINVLMLRRPSIGVDTDNINNSDEFKEKYEFNHQLFDLIGNIEKLKSPYIVQ